MSRHLAYKPDSRVPESPTAITHDRVTLMIDRREKFGFKPHDPAAVRVRFKKIAARASEHTEAPVTTEPLPSVRRTSPLPLRVKRAS